MTNFKLDHAVAILRRTPDTLRSWLADLPEAWTHENEGPDTWSAFDIMGHLVHGERTDWIQRAKHILAADPASFEPFDRFAQFEDSKGKSLGNLLDEFEALRRGNVRAIETFELDEMDFDRPGLHPSLGPVTLRQLLATWTVHDLSHLAQIARVMAKRYSNDVGPWGEFLPILSR